MSKLTISYFDTYFITKADEAVTAFHPYHYWRELLTNSNRTPSFSPSTCPTLLQLTILSSP